MANEIMIPKNLPAHIASLFQQLSEINKDACDGIGIGMYPIIKTSGTRFALVKDGEEKIVKSLELKVVILKAKAGFEKRYYEGAYDPNSTEAKAPDCYSLNGVTPEAGVAHQQNPTCAGCWANAFGSGKDANGNPSKGKACTDRKLTAVLYPNPDTKALEIYGLSLPPASLKAFGAYVTTLTANNIPLPAAFTIVGFDDKSTFPVLTFTFGGVMGEKELSQVVPLIESPEVKAIIETRKPSVSPVPPAIAHKQEEKKAEVKAEVKDDSGFGFPVEPEKKKAAVKPKADLKVAEKAPAVQASDEEEITDGDLAGLLGINLS